ncbi:MAG: hypothetical protein ABSF50_17060 [Burkholderiaceae bacterium]|jgi:phosphoribosylaminoimidazole-succinocarboxamide synthase
MKSFLITYERLGGSVEQWHERIHEFIKGIDSDAELSGRISYLCLRSKDGNRYWHVAQALDENAAADLQRKDFFKRYSESMRAIADGHVDVVPLEIVARTRGSSL